MEQEPSLRSQLHTLVGNEMKLEKRVDMRGGKIPHHVENHKNAKAELQNFLKENPSMGEHLETVKEHFFKKLYS